MYYLSHPWSENQGAMFLEPFEIIMETYMNVVSAMCNSGYKECQQVDDTVTGEKRWVPTLMCRSACEERFSAWEGMLILATTLMNDTAFYFHMD
jgi:hypothetical protein